MVLKQIRMKKMKQGQEKNDMAAGGPTKHTFLLPDQCQPVSAGFLQTKTLVLLFLLIIMNE